MELELKPLIRPSQLVPDPVTLSECYGRFTAEPFERGFGATIGNSLRRVLLSSIQGAAATSVRFYHIDSGRKGEDAQQVIRHEFSGMPGALEDVNDVILNLKQVVFKMDGVHGTATTFLEVKGPGVVKAGDFQLPSHVQVLNPDQPIATLSSTGHLKMDVLIAQGRGYQPGVYQPMEDEEDIGVIPIDALFSPVRQVSFKVTDARVGQRTDYDRLTLEVTTNGAVRPEEAVSYASKILRDHLDLFIRVEDQQSSQVTGAEAGEGDATPDSDIQRLLDKSIEELELSVRSFNCLEAASIKTIRDLVQKSENDMLKYRNFGRKSLSEIKGILKEMNLSFNMEFDDRGMPVPAREGK